MIKTITKYYCDRCGEEIEKNWTFYYNTQPHTAIKLQRGEWEYADLCGKCKESFKTWWENRGQTEQKVEDKE